MVPVTMYILYVLAHKKLNRPRVPLGNIAQVILVVVLPELHLEKRSRPLQQPVSRLLP